MALFFNEAGKSVPLDKAELSQLLSIAPSFKDEESRNVLTIDDMRFLVDTLALKGFTGTRWTDGKVYYDFDGNVDDANKDKFQAACLVWSDVADLTFIEHTGEPNYIHIQSDPGNWSYVGMIGGRQNMGIYNWNWKFIVAHEIGHALGLSHEQCRSDRDEYVRIVLDNIIEGKEHNFTKRNTVNYTTYDFASIMHYGQYAFSKNNLPTVEARPEYEDQEQYMGNRHYLTSLDAAGMAARYGAPHWHAEAA